MNTIKLPMLNNVQAGVHEALAEIINDKKSALVFRPNENDVRLVDFADLEKAAASGVTLLKDVQSKTLENLGFDLAEQGDGVLKFTPTLTAAALRYASPSAGFHCDRPNKPGDVSDTKWYHYYPPNRRDPQNPKRCRVCGSPLP